MSSLERIADADGIDPPECRQAVEEHAHLACS
jgi:hypothetical protein